MKKNKISFLLFTCIISFQGFFNISAFSNLEKELNVSKNKIQVQEQTIKNLNKEKVEIKKTTEKLSNENKNLKEENIKLKRQNSEWKSKNKIDKGEKINVELTAYCNCPLCSDNWGGITAMQTHTRTGVIAMPKKVNGRNIPLGTKVYIPSLKWYKSDGIFTVEDRGGAVIVNNRGNAVVDVWFPDHSQVEQFGRKFTTINIIK